MWDGRLALVCGFMLRFPASVKACMNTTSNNMILAYIIFPGPKDYVLIQHHLQHSKVYGRKDACGSLSSSGLLLC